MNWEAVGALGEIVGAIAVVGTLAYLAIQIRQNTSMMKAQTRDSLTTKQMMIAEWSFSNPHIAELVQKGNRDEVEPNTPEHFMLTLYWNGSFREWENSYYQYESGLYEEADFRARVRRWEKTMKIFTVRKLWQVNNDTYSPRFRAAVDAIVEAAEADA
jgi:hypothetical protein